MAHQLIFTSSVRGIKPGASGYCTVLRSPGIRPSIERALEGLSVFEHIARNVNGSVQSLRHIELRGVTYYVLSRVSDAGMDYTGRTNFLAHYLVFEANELPAVSPVDLLLNWGGWCDSWSGEPREEAVDASSFSSVARIQAPATLWQQQPCGVSPAALLATGADMKVLIQSLSLSSAELLQLIGEAFAIRTQLGHDAFTGWQTSFAVGLASDSHAKDFTWIGAYWAVEATLLRQRELIDVAATQVNAAAVDAKALAIATTGRYVEPPKPIQLTHSPAMRGVVDQALQEQASASSNHTRGARNPVIRRQSSKGGIAKPSKKRSKLPIYAVLCLVLSVPVGWFGYNVWQERQLKDQYTRIVEDMVKLVEGDNVTPGQAKNMLNKLAKSDPHANGDGGDYIKLNSELIDEASSYEDAFTVLSDLANPSEDVNTQVAAVSSSDDVIPQKVENQKVDSATHTVANLEASIDEPSVDEPEVSHEEPSVEVFAMQDLKVYFVKVGHTYPQSARALDPDVPVIVMRDFLSKHTPLTESDFVEKASYIRIAKELKIELGDQPIIIVNKNNQFDSSAKGIAVLTKTDVGGHELFLVYPERGSYCLKSEFELKSPFSAKKTFDHFNGIFDLTAFGGKHELILLDEDKKYEQLDVDPGDPSSFVGDQMVEAAMMEYELTKKDVSMDLVESKLASEVREIIKAKIEALKKPVGKDEQHTATLDKPSKKEEDFSSAISKLKELMELLKKDPGKVKDMQANINKLYENDGVDLSPSVSGQEQRKNNTADDELRNISNYISNEMEKVGWFALTHDLSKVSYRESTRGNWKKKSWQELSKEIERYVAYNSEESKREQQKKERDAFSEDKLKFSELEVRGDKRPIAKFNLKYPE
ncbi:hypothetical protein N9P58_02365 [Puniceicoccaceae bacterium]|nr:hypothetical protein [Puniceicoccaceae bacterium]